MGMRNRFLAAAVAGALCFLVQVGPTPVAQAGDQGMVVAQWQQPQQQGGQRPQRYSVGSGKNGGNPVHGDESLRTTAQNTRARVVAARPREVHYENRLILHGQPLSPSVFGKNRRAGLRTGYF